jgi:hypothetical protein
MKTITKAPIKMHNPLHPGEILRELCLDPLGLTVTQATLRPAPALPSEPLIHALNLGAWRGIK